MAYRIISPISIPEADITTPTSAQKYPMGLKIQVYPDANPANVTEYIYIGATGALTVNQPYVLTLSATGFTQKAPATLGVGVFVVVPQVAFTSGYFGFVACRGECEGLHGTETYAAGDYLQILNTGTTFVVDGSTGSTTQAVTSCAMVVDAGTTAVAKTIILLGNQAEVASG